MSGKVGHIDDISGTLGACSHSSRRSRVTPIERSEPWFNRHQRSSDRPKPGLKKRRALSGKSSANSLYLGVPRCRFMGKFCGVVSTRYSLCSLTAAHTTCGNITTRRIEMERQLATLGSSCCRRAFRQRVHATVYGKKRRQSSYEPNYCS